MKAEHSRLLCELRGAARSASPQHTDRYGGSGRPLYNLDAPTLRAIAKLWLAEHATITSDAFLAVVESLIDGESHEEKTLAALLLGYHAQARRTVRPSDVERWLGRLTGWAEIDALCQNVFTAGEMLDDWPAWKHLIERLARDPNISKRRAALVLLNGPVRYSDDGRFGDLALANIDLLKAERDILITKAVSWSLRAMIARRRHAVERCLAEHAGSLPSIAVRETRTKLATGTKSGRRRSHDPYLPG